MKKIEAIIRQERLEPVKAVLEKRGIVGMTVTEVSGRGRQKGVALQWRAGEYRVDFLPKLRLEIVVKNEDVDKVVRIIARSAWTGKVGDGKIFVSPVEKAMRIRTGESGEKAL
jgi:nitrogen regulatory protein P-II 1